MSKSDVLHVLQHGTVVAIEPLKREPATRRRPTRRKQRNLIVIESIAGGTVHVIGRVRLVHGEIKLEGVPPKLKAAFNDGIAGKDFNERGVVFPKDGRAFLDALPFEFSGSIVRARFADDEE